MGEKKGGLVQEGGRGKGKREKPLNQDKGSKCRNGKGRRGSNPRVCLGAGATVGKDT